MTDEQDKPLKKRPYSPPTVTEVKLVADEVVLVGCKTASIQGPGQTNGTCYQQVYGTPTNPCSSTSS